MIDNKYTVLLILLAVTGATVLSIYSSQAPQNAKPAPVLPASLGKTVSNLSWKDCDGTGNRYFTVSAIKVDGDFRPATTVTFTTIGTTTKEFTHASTDVVIKFGIINAYSGTETINPPKYYPVGPLQMLSQSKITDEPPSGSYTMTTRLRDSSKNLLQCVQISYKLS